ncbi:hypothetical protein BIW12_15570 [Flavobacterium commune]|uniref:Uncharacterized protein n=1 Tax=Flavobacterium commune TaxID=1306519 RepID=A0A1D9PDX5_9FLAO|nr:hypothetical protein BIW12_15570 [Flavobacterium commune]
MLKEKNSPQRRIKQFFFLRILQTFDTRLRKLRTVESQKQQNFDLYRNTPTLKSLSVFNFHQLEKGKTENSIIFKQDFT